MPQDITHTQLLRYAQDLQELMDQHVQLQEHHQRTLQLLQQDRLNSARLLDIAQHDALTGLPNRRLLEQRMAEALREAEQSGSCVYVLYMDLDRFKPINDDLGHDAGDQVLQEVARRLQTAVRRGDTVARVGGDEFVVLLHKVESHLVAQRIVESLLSSVNNPIVSGEHELRVGVSIGCAQFPADGSESATLLKRADAAMYHAKHLTTRYAFHSGPPRDKSFPRTSTGRH